MCIRDSNILVTNGRVTGILDFGDMVYSVLVADAAVAAAYALLDKPDPLAAIAAVIAGYHSTFALQQTEIAVLFDLVCMRLVMSVCHAAQQRQLAPDNTYLSISEDAAWAALERLAAIPPRFAHYTCLLYTSRCV